MSRRSHPLHAQPGQALVEFALVFPVVLAALFFMLAGLFYATEMSGVLGAAQVGSRIAAGADPASSTANALDEVARRLPALLQPGLPGTRIRYVTSPDSARDTCPAPATVTEPGSLVVCSAYATGAVSGTPVVVVRIYGRLPALFPGMPAFRVDEQAAVHSLTFAR